MLPYKILVVDDQPVNVQLLKRKLEREGLDVRTAYSGQEALEQVATDTPDLILLDLMMPGMDGIEVCQSLQSKKETRSIPVIFITARTSKEGKLEGLSVGAVDYITKPIDLDETLARVQTQLRFVSVNREMVDLQRRLQEARRAATIGAVTQGIAHNLNNLLGIVFGYLDLIKAHSHKPESVLRNAEHVESAVQRIVSIIRQLSTLVVQARLPLIPCKLDELLTNAIKRVAKHEQSAPTITVINPLGDLAINTHIEIFEDTMLKVLTNAWESYGEDHQGERPIEIETRTIERPGEPKAVEIRIRDHGRGIPPEMLDTMFEPFVSSKNTVGVGMGLTVARHALRNLGGDINLQDTPDGTVAILMHPIEKKHKEHLIS